MGLRFDQLISNIGTLFKKDFLSEIFARLFFMAIVLLDARTSSLFTTANNS